MGGSGKKIKGGVNLEVKMWHQKQTGNETTTETKQQILAH